MGCRQVAARTQLVRLVREPAPDGAAPRVRVDPTRSAPGRGAWLHPDSSCLDLALRRGGFPRAFRGVVDTGQLVRDLGPPTPPIRGTGRTNHGHPMKNHKIRK